MRTADCSSVHWLPMKQMTHEHRRRSILMFSTGSSVCCRLAGEVPVQPVAAKDCEMQAILGFKNVCWRMEIRRRVRTSSWNISLTHFKCFMKPTFTCYYTCDERLAVRWGAKLLAFSLVWSIAPDQTSELRLHMTVQNGHATASQYKDVLHCPTSTLSEDTEQLPKSCHLSLLERNRINLQIIKGYLHKSV